MVVLVGAIGATILVSRADAVSNEIRDDHPAGPYGRLPDAGALRDQETAVRGYLLTADPRFLAPYNDGRTAESAAAQEIRDSLAAYPDLLADLERIDAAAQTWRIEYADPAVAAVTPLRPTDVSEQSSEEGRALFDRLRDLFTAQNDHLSAGRVARLAHLEQIRGWRDAVHDSTMILAFITMAVLLAVVIRKAVSAPLAALAAACRRITEGNFGERDHPAGPPRHSGHQRRVSRTCASASSMNSRSPRPREAALDEQADELRRSNAELEQFAYVASHDLQEPLRKVASFCQLLEKRYGDKLDERGIEYIGFAVDGAKRMQVLINDLLTFSRVGRLNATNHRGGPQRRGRRRAGQPDHRDRGDRGRRSMRPADAASHDRRRSHAADHGVAEPDRQRRQVPPRGRAAAHRDRVPRRAPVNTPRSTCSRVTDNGIGIAEEFVDKVFVIFQRLHGRDAYTGTGIGLALCKKIVEYHGGTIWIDTSYTDGTRFRFTLPVTPTTAPNEGAGTPAGRNPMSYPDDSRAIDILLVEDDPGDELITREAFEHNKIKNNLHVAHDGEEGLDFLYRRGRPSPTPRGPI